MDDLDTLINSVRADVASSPANPAPNQGFQPPKPGLQAPQPARDPLDDMIDSVRQQTMSQQQAPPPMASFSSGIDLPHQAAPGMPAPPVEQSPAPYNPLTGASGLPQIDPYSFANQQYALDREQANQQFWQKRASERAYGQDPNAAFQADVRGIQAQMPPVDPATEARAVGGRIRAGASDAITGLMATLDSSRWDADEERPDWQPPSTFSEDLNKASRELSQEQQAQNPVRSGVGLVASEGALLGGKIAAGVASGPAAPVVWGGLGAAEGYNRAANETDEQVRAGKMTPWEAQQTAQSAGSTGAFIGAIAGMIPGFGKINPSYANAMFRSALANGGQSVAEDMVARGYQADPKPLGKIIEDGATAAAFGAVMHSLFHMFSLAPGDPLAAEGMGIPDKVLAIARERWDLYRAGKATLEEARRPVNTSAADVRTINNFFQEQLAKGDQPPAQQPNTAPEPQKQVAPAEATATNAPMSDALATAPRPAPELQPQATEPLNPQKGQSNAAIPQPASTGNLLQHADAAIRPPAASAPEQDQSQGQAPSQEGQAPAVRQEIQRGQAPVEQPGPELLAPPEYPVVPWEKAHGHADISPDGAGGYTVADARGRAKAEAHNIAEEIGGTVAPDGPGKWAVVHQFPTYEEAARYKEIQHFTDDDPRYYEHNELHALDSRVADTNEFVPAFKNLKNGDVYSGGTMHGDVPFPPHIQRVFDASMEKTAMFPEDLLEAGFVRNGKYTSREETTAIVQKERQAAAQPPPEKVAPAASQRRVVQLTPEQQNTLDLAASHMDATASPSPVPASNGFEKKLQGAMDSGDERTIAKLVNRSVQGRKYFQQQTGVKLPVNVRDAMDAIDAWAKGKRETPVKAAEVPQDNKSSAPPKPKYAPTDAPGKTPKLRKPKDRGGAIPLPNPQLAQVAIGAVRGIRERYAPIEHQDSPELASALTQHVQSGTTAKQIVASFERDAFGGHKDRNQLIADFRAIGWNNRATLAKAKGLPATGIPTLTAAEEAKIRAQPEIPKAIALWNKTIAPEMQDIRMRNKLPMDPNASKVDLFLNLPTELDPTGGGKSAVNLNPAFSQPMTGEGDYMLDPHDTLVSVVRGHLRTDASVKIADAIRNGVSIDPNAIIKDPNVRANPAAFERRPEGSGYFEAKYKGLKTRVGVVDLAAVDPRYGAQPELHYVPLRVAQAMDKARQELAPQDNLIDKFMHGYTRLGLIGDFAPHSLRVVMQAASRMGQSGQSAAHLVPWLGSVPATIWRLSTMAKNAYADTLQLLVDKSGSSRGTGFNLEPPKNKLTKIADLAHHALMDPEVGIDPRARRLVADAHLRMMLGNRDMDDFEARVRGGKLTAIEAAKEIENKVGAKGMQAIGRRVNATMGFSDRHTRNNFLNDAQRFMPFLSTQSGMIPDEIRKLLTANLNPASVVRNLKRGEHGRALLQIATMLATGALGTYLLKEGLNYLFAGHSMDDNEEGHVTDVELSPGWHLSNLDPTTERAMRLTGLKERENTGEFDPAQVGRESVNEVMSSINPGLRAAFTTATGDVPYLTKGNRLMTAKEGWWWPIGLGRNTLEAMAGDKDAGDALLKDMVSFLTGFRLKTPPKDK